ncbi:M48 family metallopeptidase [Ammoniphilus sp. YIM 78166]|uniref:tetratricopeptide repeat protein n=1 Tax=Ammoniphilus sp. YIM 78166 TaxID=1644106 RepID=UPI0010700FF6|nr:hypothetical protein [Ammoniphilus sp. YIM 78166]
MNSMELTPLSFTIGFVVVLVIATLRFYYPFRYQYLCLLFRRSPNGVKRLLHRSYRKNRSAVGLLDRATMEILEGHYDEAEKFVLKGIQQILQVRGLRNQLIRTFFYSHLSWILYYRGQYKESLEISIRLYERVPSTPNILALISCNLARVGEIGRAIEVSAKLKQMKRISPTILLSCEAEIEAAKGNIQKALKLLDQAKLQKKSHFSIYFIHYEIEKRIGELNKSA